MKTLIFTTFIFVTSLASAEIKPAGALVPSQCGDNTVEAVAASPDYVSEVCLWTMTGGEPADLTNSKPLFSLQTAEGMSFYIALGQVQVGPGEWVWQGYQLKVTKPGAYYFITGVDLMAPSVEVTFLASSGGVQLQGPELDASLEPVFTTLSVD